jgi:hypothetical protein
MTKIGDGRTPGGLQPEKADLNQVEREHVSTSQQKATADRADRTKESSQQAGTDLFMDSFVQGNVAARLANIAQKNKPNLGPVQFTNQQLAQIAEQFAVLLRKKPNADRKERARMFAQSIITNSKFGKIFDKASERELESLYDAIAQQLDGVPVLAQLVDEVTDWTLRSPIQRG